MGNRRLITSPAFQFYPQDWLVGTSGMTLAAKGAYMQIIAFGWLKGPLAFDLDSLAKLIGCSRGELNDVWAQVLPKLRETKRGFVNRRVEKQRGVLRSFRKSRQKAAQTRWAKHRQEKPTDEPANATPPAWKPAPEKYQSLHNGASTRRHGQHAACNERGLCVTQWVHEELLGKLGGVERESELRGWYANTITALNGQPIGDEPDKFWRNKFAEWIPPVTTIPDTTSRAAQNIAGARRTLAKIAAGTVEPFALNLPGRRPS